MLTDLKALSLHIYRVGLFRYAWRVDYRGRMRQVQAEVTQDNGRGMAWISGRQGLAGGICCTYAQADAHGFEALVRCQDPHDYFQSVAGRCSECGAVIYGGEGITLGLGKILCGLHGGSGFPHA